MDQKSNQIEEAEGDGRLFHRLASQCLYGTPRPDRKRLTVKEPRLLWRYVLMLQTSECFLSGCRLREFCIRRVEHAIGLLLCQQLQVW